MDKCIILIQALVPVIFGLYSVVLGQDTNWDLQNYHLYNPYAFLNGRLNLDLSPAGMNTCFNPFIDLAYWQLIHHAAPWMAGFVIGFIQGLNFILLFHICKSCLKSINVKYDTWAIYLALLGVLSVGFLSELGTVYWDNIISLFLLCSLLMIITSMDSIISGKRCAFWGVALAGLMAGLGAGLKPNVVLFGFSLFISIFFIPLSWAQRPVLALLLAGGFVTGFLLTDGLWLWRIWHQMGNPIFPLMNNIFHSKFAPIAPIRDYRFLPRSFLEEIFYPVIFTFAPLRVGELVYKQLNWVAVYLISICFFFRMVFSSIYKSSATALSCQVRYVILFFWSSFLFWASIFGIYRYQIVIEMLIPLIIFVLILSIFKVKVLTQRIVVLILGVFTIYNFNGIPDWGRAPWGQKVLCFETKWAQKDKVDAFILIGQPLAWIIPALDVKKPFIQIMPNFQVNKAYVERARSLLKDSHDGKVLAIFNPLTISPMGANKIFGVYGFKFDEANCTRERGYIGKRKFVYLFCPSERI